MKKQIIIICFAIVSLSANAQLKVYSSGKTYMGGTATTPLSMLSVGGAGATIVESYVYQPTIGHSYAAFKAEAATTTNSGNNSYGVTGNVPSAGQNTYGVCGGSFNATAQTSAGQAFGVYGYAGNAYTTNYGVIGVLAGSKNGAGVFGSTSFGTTFTQQYAGYFKGEFETTDDTPQKPNGGSWSGASDKRIKKDITNFKDGLSVLRKIRPVNYKYNGIGGFPTAKAYIGVIAQEVQPVAPYCVGKTRIFVSDAEKSNFANDIVETLKDSTGNNKYIAEILNYNRDGLFYVMVNSIKELDSTVTSLKTQLAKNDMQGTSQRTMQNHSSTEKNETTINIQLANNIVLYQNEPNPTNSKTTIRYYIPENIHGAYIEFYDLFGKEIKKVEVRETGAGKIEADTQNLSEGIYSYSLIVHGEVVDTKKMMKNK